MVVAITNVTLSPSDLYRITLSNGDLTFTSTGANSFVRATHGRTSGKLYWEVKLDSGYYLNTIGISNKNFTTYLETSPDFRAYRGSSTKIPEIIPYGDGKALAVGDIIGVALNLDIGTLEFYKNGVSMGISHTDLSGLGEVFPTFGAAASNVKTMTVNFGSKQFAYPMPISYYSYDGSQFNGINKVLFSSDDGTYKTITEIDKVGSIVPKMSSNVQDGFTISAINELSSRQAWNAFDRDINLNFRSGSGSSGWLRVDLPVEEVVVKYYVNNNNLSSTPGAWTFEGSNDGLNWIILDTQSAQPASIDKYYPIANPQSFKSYRINVTATNSGGSYLYIYEMQIYRKPNFGTLSEVSMSERNILKYGMDIPLTIDFSTEMINKAFIEQSQTILGNGKVFKKSIDASKLAIKKVTIK